MVFKFATVDELVTSIELISDPAQIGQMDLRIAET
jgi:hypothetical protein